MEDNLHLTQSGAVCGTPIYMSPEQALKQKVDPRSDIYSLGATYYSLLTAWPPYLGLSVVQIALQHVRSPTPDPRMLVPDIPETCVRVLMRAMEKKKEARYQEAAEMGADLEALLMGGSQRTISIFDLDQNREAVPKLTPAATPPGLTPSDPAAANPLTTQAETLRTTVVDLPKDFRDSVENPRRKFLIRGLLGLLAVGTASGGAFFYHRHSRSIPSKQEPPKGAQPQPLPPIPVGVLQSLSGALAVSERPLAHATLLALDELNAQGGLLGRQLRPILLDGRSEVTAESAFTQGAEQLLAKDKVVVVFGGYGSAARRSMRPYFEKHDGLLFYPGDYEGLEESRNIIYLGATPNQFALPAIQWCAKQLHARRYFVIGSDGMRAHAISTILTDAIQELGGEVVGAHYDLVGETQFAPTVKRIERARPDVVLNLLVGDSCAAFVAALLQLDGSQPQPAMLSFFPSTSALAYSRNPKLTRHYVAHARFARTPGVPQPSLALRLAKQHGTETALSDEIETAYYGVHLWAAAVKRAGSTEISKVKEALTDGEYDLLGAHLRVDPSNQHLWKVFELKRVVSDSQLEILETGAALIPPLPFPSARTQTEWQDFTDSLYQKWGNNWANPLKPHAVKKSK